MNKSGYFKKLLMIFFITALAIGVSVCPLPAQELPRSSQTSLWKVASGNHNVYLLGSIHFLKEKNHPLPGSMEQAFEDAHVVVFEMDMEDAKGGNDQQLLLTKGMYPPGRTLKAGIRKDTYDLLRTQLEVLGLDIQMFASFKPWFVTLTLLSVKLQMSGFDPAYGIDHYFLVKARKSQKEIMALETMAEQIDIFDGLSDSDQEALILQTLRDMDTMDAEIDRLVAAWREGDGEAMSGLILKSFRDYPVIYDRLILRRNKKWLDRIEQFMRQRENVLVIVGAGHLIGADGLVEMLKRKGYTVDQL
jgi:uncharacterized protein